MTDGVPLVIPEVNPEAMAGMKWNDRKGGIIANPNCSTIIALMAVTPIHKKAGVKRMVVSTYQAASGAGAAAMAELELQMREVLDGKPPTTTIFGRQVGEESPPSAAPRICCLWCNKCEVDKLHDSRLSAPARAQAWCW